MESLQQAAPMSPSSDLVVLDQSNPVRRRVVLVGQPNVGKSVVFSLLTSHYALVSNFPGTTVDIFSGKTRVGNQEYEILDTPGINGTEAVSEDEQVTLSVLRDRNPDVLVQVADAKNLRRALILTAKLARFRIPMVLVLNMMDECEERGIHVDSAALSSALGVPVVETIAVEGVGKSALRDSLSSARPVNRSDVSPMAWADEVLTSVRAETKEIPRRETIRTSLLVLAAVVGTALHLENYFAGFLGMPSLAGFVGNHFSGDWGLGPLTTALATVLLAYLAPVLLPVLIAIKVDARFNQRFGVWARRPISGLLILGVTISLTYQLVGNLGAQVLVEVLEDGLFGALITPLLQRWIPDGFLHDLLVGPFGIVSMGVAYGLAIVLPVVTTFFVAFSFLEDSGYLPRLSILSDRVLRTMGLHGKAFLPMVLGLGCVTMATMTTRILNSKKERFIATFLLALGVPCSAQLGVILGITAGLPVAALLTVFATVFLQLILVGCLLSRVCPGNRSSFIMELPPIRFPVWKNILHKTGLRVLWFLQEALPLFALGALVLFTLDRLGILGWITATTQPVIHGLLGLPDGAASVFLMGFLRRDYGAAGLFEMARNGQLDTTQVVVGLTVLTLFVPCIANSLVMIKEQGVRAASLMIVSILAYAVLVGAGLNALLRLFSPGW